MKKIVDFSSVTDEKIERIGSIILDENNKISFSKNFPSVLKQDLEMGMALGGKVWSIKDGEEFLKRLRYIYSGSRLRASRIKLED